MYMKVLFANFVLFRGQDLRGHKWLEQRSRESQGGSVEGALFHG